MKKILLLCLLTLSSAATASGVASTSGLISIAIPAIGIVYSGTSGDIEGLKEIAMSSLVTAQLTTFLKNTVHRTRPNGDDQLSFPSGHAAASFMGASFLQNRYGWRWGVPMYALATVISVERVGGNDHYWTDIIAGAALGWGVAALFTVEYPNVRFEPIVDTQKKTYGLNVSANFW